MREFRLVHLVHQRADLFRAHRDAGEHTDLQRGTQKNGAQSLLEGHESLSARATAQTSTADAKSNERQAGGTAGVEAGQRRGCGGVAAERLNKAARRSGPVEKDERRRDNNPIKGRAAERQETRYNDERDAGDRNWSTAASHAPIVARALESHVASLLVGVTATIGVEAGGTSDLARRLDQRPNEIAGRVSHRPSAVHVRRPRSRHGVAESLAEQFVCEQVGDVRRFADPG